MHTLKQHTPALCICMQSTEDIERHEGTKMT